MPIVDKDTLKSYFINGKNPAYLKYVDLIDSLYGNEGILVTEGPGIDIVGYQVGLGGDTILLYDNGGNPIAEYTCSEAGLIAALSAAASGDVVFLPAGEIGGLTQFTEEHTFDSDFGDWIEYQEVSIGVGDPGTTSFDASHGHDANGSVSAVITPAPSMVAQRRNGVRYSPVGMEVSTGDYISAWFYKISQTLAGPGDQGCYSYIKVYWVGGTTTEISTIYPIGAWSHLVFTVNATDDGKTIDHIDVFGECNSQSIGSWYIDDIEITTSSGSGSFTVPSGVELVGLGRNAILNANIINNGILTNLKVTGTISGSGIVRLVANPDSETFSRIIHSTVQSGTAPFNVESSGLVTNLNADLLDGMHAHEIMDASSGAGGVEISQENVSNPPTEDQLITAFGAPDAFADDGKIGVLNDNGLRNNAYAIFSDGGHYWLLPLAKAVQTTLGFSVASTATIVATAGGLWYGRASVEKLASGILVMVYKKSSHHGENDGDLRIRFSTDQGATWTAEDTFTDGSAVSGFPMNPSGASAGEDAGEPWLYVAPNGNLILHMWRVDYGVTANGTYQSVSTDGGKTWSASAQINFSGIADDAKVFATDDHFVYNNIIYAAARQYDDATPTNLKNILIKSTDNGATWEYISDISSFTTDTEEVGIEYIGNSTIVAILRAYPPGTYTYKATSTDMGATWSALTDISSSFGISGRVRIQTRAHLKGYDNWWSDSILLACGFIFAAPPSGYTRRNAIWISQDKGATWNGPNYVDVQTDDAGYGDMFWDAANNRFVFVCYQGTQDEASIKQYNLTITGI